MLCLFLPLAMWTAVKVFVELLGTNAPFYELCFQRGSVALLCTNLHAAVIVHFWYTHDCLLLIKFVNHKRLHWQIRSALKIIKDQYKHRQQKASKVYCFLGGRWSSDG